MIRKIIITYMYKKCCKTIRVMTKITSFVAEEPVAIHSSFLTIWKMPKQFWLDKSAVQCHQLLNTGVQLQPWRRPYTCLVNLVAAKRMIFLKIPFCQSFEFGPDLSKPTNQPILCFVHPHVWMQGLHCWSENPFIHPFSHFKFLNKVIEYV